MIDAITESLLPLVVPIESISLDPRNARNHPKVNLETLRFSLETYGQRKPIVVNQDTRHIEAGNGLYMAAKELGWTRIAAVMVKDSPQTATGFALMDNQSALLSKWDDETLADLLRELKVSGFPMDGTGFQPIDIEKLLGAGGTVGLTDEDEVPEQVETVCKPGDLWKLGDHRLLCGDATSMPDVVLLLQDEKSNMVFTDPPYNVSYGESKNPRHHIRSIANDAQSPDEWRHFNLAFMQALRDYNLGDIYLWGASGPEGMKQRLWLTELGCHWSATIIWKKQQLVLSPANYQRMYEPCFYGWFGKSSFNADRKQTEVWDIDRPLKSDLHPTMKPVSLCEIGVCNSSKPGEIVMDLFGGSGSTLIACEKTSRRCRMLELDPHYCDVIITRWEKFTGRKAEVINGKEVQISCGGGSN